MLLSLLSRHSNSPWACWQAVRALTTVQLSAEAAQRVAQHGAGIVQLPSDMVQTLDGYFKEARLTGKVAKLRSRALTEQLKVLSRSQARGGLQPYRQPDTAGPGAAASPEGQGMTAEQLREAEELEAELDQMAAVFGPEALQQQRAARAAARSAAALPMAKTRSGRLKASARAALVDHISRHGLLSVPHEHARAALGLPPSASLDSPASSAAVRQATPSYNEAQALVYALSRLPACYAAAARVFRELGVRQGGFRPGSLLDVGAGPGTASWAAQEVWSGSLRHVTAVEPSAAMRRLGVRLEAARRFSHEHAPLVRWQAELPPEPRRQQQQQQQPRARRYDLVVASYVLNELASPGERLALVKQLWGLTSDVLVLLEPGTPAGAANILEARAAVLQREKRRAAKLNGCLDRDGSLAQKSSSRWLGAHVVAPCPHDGACPMAAPGSKAWCHFGSRFQRPAFMQAAKAPPGRSAHPANHQDERFSYVVLRRGPRPSAADVDISPAFLPRPRQLEGLNELPETDLFAGNGDEQQQQQQRGEAADDERMARANKRLNLFGQGLVDRLIALEDAGVDWAGSADGLATEVAALAAAQQGGPNQTQLQSGSDQHHGTNAASSALLDSQQHQQQGQPQQQQPQQQEQPQPQEQPQQQQQPQQQRDVPPEQGMPAPPLQQADVDAAAACSASWSRIIRPPRRRGGHVILDLCTAGDGSQAAADIDQGRLERHIIARSDAHGWMGKAAYSMAQSAKWGDLWPTPYNKNKKRQIVAASANLEG